MTIIKSDVKAFFAETTGRVQTNWNNMSTAHKVAAIVAVTLSIGTCALVGVFHGAIAASFLGTVGSIALYAVLGTNTLATFSSLLSDLLKKSHEKAKALSQKAVVAIEMVTPKKSPKA